MLSSLRASILSRQRAASAKLSLGSIQKVESPLEKIEIGGHPVRILVAVIPSEFKLLNQSGRVSEPPSVSG
jgi:hypothetical protein